MNKFYQHKTPQTGLCKYEKYFPEITDEGINDLYCLIEIVRNSHFTYITDEFLIEDMESAAMLAMLEFIKSGAFDPTRGGLKNVLYTRCRNEMKNCVYRNGRDFTVDDEVMAVNEAPHIQVSTTLIEFNDLDLPRCTPEEVEKVKSSLNYLGFMTDSKQYKWYEEVSRWVAYVVYRRLKK